MFFLRDTRNESFYCFHNIIKLINKEKKTRLERNFKRFVEEKKKITRLLSKQNPQRRDNTPMKVYSTEDDVFVL